MHVLLLLACAVVTAAPTADWPRFRGPNGDGISPLTGIRKDWNVRPPRLAWKADMHDGGYAGPSVAGGVLYIVDHEGTQDVVRALRMKDGSEVWRVAYDEDVKSSYGFARATPTVDGNRLYTVSRSGLLLCLDTKSGRQIWTRHLQTDFQGERPMWWYSAPVLIDGRKAIVCPGGKVAAVVALDKSTGKEIWRGGDGDVPGYGQPVIAALDGRRQYVMTVWKGFAGIDSENGKLLWRFDWPTLDGTNVAEPIVVNGGVFISSSYNMGCALLNVKDGAATPRWKTLGMKAHFNTPVLWQGKLYGMSDPGYLECLDPATGEAAWRQSGFEKGGVVAVDGVLIALCGSTGAAVMVRLAPDRYEELGRFTPLGGQSWSPPIVADGKLVIRNTKTLACYDLK